MANKPLPNSLPADLPEDWQYNQIVAPAGADVGLSTQHGYNYLMEQVNAVQEAVNQINNAFANLASLSADGKISLDQLVIDAALSATSGNPVQNKVVQQAIAGINQALAGKAPAGNYAGSNTLGGAANTAVKLQTARSVQVNLGSTAAVNFDGSGNISPGVQGILGVTSGGTGANNAAAARTALGITAANIGASRIVTGIYAGNGSARKGSTLAEITGGQFINLGVTPKFVMVAVFSSQDNYAALVGTLPGYAYSRIATSDIRQFIQQNNWKVTTNSGEVEIDIVEGGFYVGRITPNGQDQNNTNALNNKYTYIAII